MSRELKLGTGAVAAAVVIHTLVAWVINDWEAAISTFLLILIFGLVVGALVFGLIVRWGVRGSAQHAAIAGLATSILSILSYGVFFIGAPPIIGAGGAVLGQVGLNRAQSRQTGIRATAWIAILVGLAAIAFWLFLYAFALATDDFPSWAFFA